MSTESGVARIGELKAKALQELEVASSLGISFDLLLVY